MQNTIHIQKYKLISTKIHHIKNIYIYTQIIQKLHRNIQKLTTIPEQYK